MTDHDHIKLDALLDDLAKLREVHAERHAIFQNEWKGPDEPDEPSERRRELTAEWERLKDLTSSIASHNSFDRADLHGLFSRWGESLDAATDYIAFGRYSEASDLTAAVQAECAHLARLLDDGTGESS